jgi:hypothetical protein
MNIEYMNRLFELLVELLDIPRSHYEKATERYRSLGDWFHRDESGIAGYEPEVYPQGSFRYGTVIRPLVKTEEYDLDLVCQIALNKAQVCQSDVKYLVGTEVKAYAEAHSFKEPAEEKHRCWRLNYADHVSFHMDILPSIPEDSQTTASLIHSRVPSELAATAIAITDNRHPHYALIANDWPSSNPRGYARWFEGRMRGAAESRLRQLVQERAYATVDEIPTYEWKTPLQRSIQILKRHRDVMFMEAPEWKPLSMVITTLAAHAYGGESDLSLALFNIVEGMPTYIRSARPRVPNPVNPAEDFADRWATDPRYEQHFRLWHGQLQATCCDSKEWLERRRTLAASFAGSLQLILLPTWNEPCRRRVPYPLRTLRLPLL